MGWPIETIGTWNHFAEWADWFILRAGNAYLFRGQSDAGWDNLKPSLTRLVAASPVTEVLEIERQAWMIFTKQSHRYFNLATIDDRDDPLDWWPLMQHYRAPTRLLDWTASPYVAAYFAVAENWNSDGVVWFFHPFLLNQAMEEKYPIENFQQSDGRVKAKSVVFDPNAPARLIPFYQRFDDARMFAQQGHFTVCLHPLADHAKVMEEALVGQPNTFGRVIIRKELKPEFLLRLRAMSIGANSLFPGMDGIGLSIAELVRLHRVPPPPHPFELIQRGDQNVGNHVGQAIHVRYLRPTGGDPEGMAGWVGPEVCLPAEPTPDNMRGRKGECQRE